MADFLTFDNIGDQVENLIDDDDTTIRTIIDQVINNVYRDIMGEFRKGRNIPPWLKDYDDLLTTSAGIRTTTLASSGKDIERILKVSVDNQPCLPISPEELEGGAKVNKDNASPTYWWDIITEGSELAPEACCTDPDNDQDNTTGWTAVNATLTSEAGGVTGNRLKVAVTADNGQAKKTGISLTAGKLYSLKVKAGADVGDNYKVELYSFTYGGNAYASGSIAGTGAGNWDTIDEIIECPSTRTDWVLKLIATNNGDNAYFDNVSLRERVLSEKSRPTRFYHEKSFSSAGVEVNKLVWFPLPDAAYDIRYWFEKRVSILVNADDVPLLPFWAHQALVWGSLVQMPMFDIRVKSGPWDMLYEQVINQLMGFSNNFVIDGSTVPFGL